MSRLHKFKGIAGEEIRLDTDQIQAIENDGACIRVFTGSNSLYLDFTEYSRLLDLVNKPQDQNIWTAVSYNARRLTELQQQIDELHALCSGDVLEDDDDELPLPRPADGNVRIALEIPQTEAREVVDLLMKWKLDIEPVDVDEVVKRLEETQVMVKTVMADTSS